MSWVNGYLRPFQAIMALSHFSIACWTLLPKTSSPIWWLGTSFMSLAALALLEALLANTLAIALFDKRDAFPLDLVLHSAESAAPFPVIGAAHHHQIDGLAKPLR